MAWSSVGTSDRISLLNISRSVSLLAARKAAERISNDDQPLAIIGDHSLQSPAHELSGSPMIEIFYLEIDRRDHWLAVAAWFNEGQLDERRVHGAQFANSAPTQNQIVRNDRAETAVNANVSDVGTPRISQDDINAVYPRKAVTTHYRAADRNSARSHRDDVSKVSILNDQRANGAEHCNRREQDTDHARQIVSAEYTKNIFVGFVCWLLIVAVAALPMLLGSSHFLLRFCFSVTIASIAILALGIITA